MSAPDVIQHFAGANGELPEGLHFKYSPKEGEHVIDAHVPGEDRPVGRLSWAHAGSDPNERGGYYPGEISSVRVNRGYQRRGIANAMMEHAHQLHQTGQVDTPPVHSTVRTPEGDSWADAVSGDRDADWEEGQHWDSADYYHDGVARTKSPPLNKGDFVRTTLLQHFGGSRGPLPELKFTHSTMMRMEQPWMHKITAEDHEGANAGHLMWYGKHHEFPGEIASVYVPEKKHQGRGVASAMVEHARQLHQSGQVDSTPIHSQTLTEEGEHFVRGEGGPSWGHYMESDDIDDMTTPKQYHEDVAGPPLTKKDFVKTTGKDRINAAWGSNDMDTIMHGSPMTIAPWPQAGRRKDRHDYDHEVVRKALQSPPKLEPIDPRTLSATQPNITRQALEHYMSDKGKTETFGDHGNPGNTHPVVYHRDDGTHMLLSGHHRAAAALLKGEPLMAVHLHGGWPKR